MALFDSSVSGQHVDEIVHCAVTMKVNELSIDLRPAALSCIENKELQVTADARSASVAETTLRRWITALSSGQEVRRGTHTLMTMTEERALVGLILTRQSLNAPFTKQTAGQVASLMLTRRGWKFGNAANLPSRDWWEAFLKWWPGLSFRKTSRLSGDALLRPTRGNLEPWFELVQELQKLVPRGRWFNMDESQVCPDGGSKTVLVARGSQHIHVPKPGYSKHVTIAPCVSADGDVLSTLWVFQGKRVTTDLLKGADSKDAVAVTGGFSCLSHHATVICSHGWMTSKLFLLYLSVPAPPKRTRGKRKAKPKSGGSSEKPKSRSKPSAKPKRKTRNKRIFDEDGDFQSSPAPLNEWKAFALASPASSAPSSNAMRVLLLNARSAALRASNHSGLELVTFVSNCGIRLAQACNSGAELACKLSRVRTAKKPSRLSLSGVVAAE